MLFAANYKQVVLTLVGNLKQLRNFSEKLHLENNCQLIDNAINRLETNSFSIAVVGEFKRGKSTFINALLGQEILPSDVLPTTATLNRVTYGLQPLVKIIFKDDEQREIAINKLPSFVTKLTPECEAVAMTVKEAVIYYPVNCCRNNVEIIDTPGLSDDENMTAVTLSIIQKVDAAIMVTSALAPFAESEGNFITQKLLTNSLGCIIFIATGIDHFKRSQDADKVVKTIEKRIASFVEDWAKQQFDANSQEYKFYLNKIGKPKVFGLSAYQALSAKVNNNDALLNQSHFGKFELALQKLLREDREKIILQVVVNHVSAIATEIIQIINNQQYELELQQQNLSNKCYQLQNIILNFNKIKTKKILLVNPNNDKIKSQVNLLIQQLENRLKQTVERVIESIEVNSTDGIKLQQQCATYISSAVQSASQIIVEQIQNVIKQELSAAVWQMQSLLEIAPEVMHSVEIHLTQIDDDLGFQTSSLQRSNSLNQAFEQFNREQSSNLLILFTCSSETFIFKSELSGLSSVIGDVAGSLFDSLGKAVGVGFGNLQKANNLKTNYKSKVIAEIENQLRSHQTKQSVDEYIYQVYKNLEVLKVKVDREINSWIENVQNTLAKVQGKQQALAENQRKILDTMRNETQTILNNALILSEQLYQNINLDKHDNFEKKTCINCGYANESTCKFCIKCGTRLTTNK